MKEVNVKIVRDPRKSHKLIKVNNSKNIYVKWFDKNAL